VALPPDTPHAPRAPLASRAPGPPASPLRRHVAGPAALVHWPGDAVRRRELAALRIPRLLLVAPDAAPPEVDDDEDWARLPTDERDTAARLASLRARHATVTLAGRDLRTARGAVTLSPAEAAALAVLLDSPGRVVPRHELAGALAGHGAVASRAVASRAVDDVASRLRRRLRPLGLDVFAARSRGHLLGPRLDWPVAEGLSLD
jgi:DNA-binding response OmpR family regulator